MERECVYFPSLVPIPHGHLHFIPKYAGDEQKWRVMALQMSPVSNELSVVIIAADLSARRQPEHSRAALIPRAPKH